MAVPSDERERLVRTAQSFQKRQERGSLSADNFERRVGKRLVKVSWHCAVSHVDVDGGGDGETRGFVEEVTTPWQLVEGVERWR